MKCLLVGTLGLAIAVYEDNKLDAVMVKCLLSAFTVPLVNGLAEKRPQCLSAIFAPGNKISKRVAIYESQI